MAPRTWLTALILTAAIAAPAASQDTQRRRTRDAGRSSPPRQAERAPERAERTERAVPRTTPPVREQQQQARREEQARRDSESRAQADGRRDNGRNDRNDRGRYDGGRYDNGRYDSRRNTVSRYGGRYDNRRYTPRVIRPTIVRVVPYRPYVYRPSYSVGVYYGSGGYYPYGHTPRGYYDPIPGRYYGGVRITGAPRDARVFADGYYVGIVNDFDGIFQHLNLEAGPHHVEIDLGYDAIEFDVYVRPGETITFRADRY